MKKVEGVGARLRALRGQQTQIEFAEMLGVNVNSLRRYEYGQRKIPPDVLRALEEKFLINQDWLLLGLGPKNRKTKVSSELKSTCELEENTDGNSNMHVNFGADGVPRLRWDKSLADIALQDEVASVVRIALENKEAGIIRGFLTGLNIAPEIPRTNTGTRENYYNEDIRELEERIEWIDDRIEEILLNVDPQLYDEIIPPRNVGLALTDMRNLRYITLRYEKSLYQSILEASKDMGVTLNYLNKPVNDLVKIIEYITSNYSLLELALLERVIKGFILSNKLWSSLINSDASPYVDLDDLEKRGFGTSPYIGRLINEGDNSKT